MHHPTGALAADVLCQCIDAVKVVIAWAVELVQLVVFYRALRVLLLSGLLVLGVKKGQAFLSWYVKVSEFQSSPNQGLGLLN